MKTIVAILLLSAAMVTHAEDVQSFLVCEEWPVVKQMLDASAERPFLKGLSHRGINGELARFETIIFVNPDSGTFTVVERWTDEMFCVVQSGTVIRPYSALSDN